MGVRLTGFSTPFVGLDWEYTENKAENIVKAAERNPFDGKKIRVFISSICGIEKYDRIRTQLESLLLDTGFFEIYKFEDEGASTISAGDHYKYELKYSDVCVFLIDNADGVRPGVQAEIDLAKQLNKKALFYFCDECSKEKTVLEQGLMGAQFAKSTTVHHFDDLGKNGAEDLIKDIIRIYRFYCAGDMLIQSLTDVDEHHISNLHDEDAMKYSLPKSVLNNIDKCKKYFLNNVLWKNYFSDDSLIENTSELDDWCETFLAVLFEGASVKRFNSLMFLKCLSELQPKDFFEIVQIRWSAVQAHYMGDAEQCICYLQEALKKAKETKQPAWLINDILIDLRNEEQVYYQIIGTYYVPSPAQKELDERPERVYYPLIDRIHNSIRERYIDGLFKNKTRSPYTVTLGNDFSIYAEMFASAYVIAMYNGSLTHLTLIYKELEEYFFYCSSVYGDIIFRNNLLKMSVIHRGQKYVNELLGEYPEILVCGTSDSAKEMMDFCENEPLAYRKLMLRMTMMRAVGYLLDDKTFTYYSNEIITGINNWFEKDNYARDLGNYIFPCLSKISLRLSQDDLATICCKFLEFNYSRWYDDMFKFMAYHIDINKLTEATAKRLMDNLIIAMDNKVSRECMFNSPTFIYTFRKNNRLLTEELHTKIQQIMPQFYDGSYSLETNFDNPEIVRSFGEKYLERIKSNNKTQGKDGVFYGYGVRNIATLNNIISNAYDLFSQDFIDDVVNTLVETVLESKESISIKMDAVKLLIVIVLKYPGDYCRRESQYERLFVDMGKVDEFDVSIAESNVQSIALKVGLQFLYTAMGIDASFELMELLSYIQDNTASLLEIEGLICDYLEENENYNIPASTEFLLLQHCLEWIQSENGNIRRYAVRILMSLAQNPANRQIVNRMIIKTIDSDDHYIKNYILRYINDTPNIYKETLNHVIEKCRNDTHFAVRQVCIEEFGN